MKLSEMWVNCLTVVFTILIVSIFFISFYYTVIFISDDIQDLNHASYMVEHIQDNELLLPFPTVLEYPLGINHMYEYAFNLELDAFHIFLINNFEYSEGLYDCKYWSYVWSMYWERNKDKYDWDIEFVDTQNHVFVMVSNETSYCIMDQKNLDCINYK